MKVLPGLSALTLLLLFCLFGCGNNGPIAPGTSSQPPTAVATAEPNPQFVGEDVMFSGLSSVAPEGETISAYEWDWDNDGAFDCKGPEAERSWDAPGIYHVQLRVTASNGKTHELDQALEVVIITSTLTDPIARAVAEPLQQYIGEPVHFRDDGSFDPDGGAITAYEWDWENDGVWDETGKEADHTWDTAGKYRVQFRVTDDEGKTDTLDQPLVIDITGPKLPPIASASANRRDQSIGEPAKFTGTASYDPDGGPIVKYEWDWENDGVFDQEGAEVAHIWNDIGLHYVGFRATDDEGETTALDEPIEVYVGGIPTNMVEVTPPYLNIMPEDLSISGNYLHVISRDDRLFTFDITQPGNPEYLSSIELHRGATGLATDGSYVYVVNQSSYYSSPSGLSIYDVDPAGQAHLLSSLDWDAEPSGQIAVSNSIVCVDDYKGLVVVDASNPEAPSVAATLPLYGGYIDAQGGYAYVVSQGTLYVVDIDPPASASVIAQVPVDQYAGEISVDGDWACVLGYHYVFAVHISTPTSPVVTGSVHLGNAAYVDVESGYAYVTESDYYGPNRFCKIDLTPPEGPQGVLSFPLLYKTYQYIGPVCVQDGYAYIGSDRGLFALDIDPIQNATITGTYLRQSSISTLRMKDDYLLGSFSNSPGLTTYDISDPERTTASAVTLLDSPRYLMEVDGDYAYTRSDNQMIVLNVSDPTTPYTAMTFNAVWGWHIDDLAVENGYAYVVEDKLVEIVDVDPLQGAHVVNQGLGIQGWYAGVYAVDNYAFISDYNSTRLFDMSDPSTPVLLGSSPPVWLRSSECSVHDGFLFHAADDLEIYDIVPIEKSHLVKTVVVEHHCHAVAVSGGYAYCASDSGLIVVDIDPIWSAHVISGIALPNEFYGNDCEEFGATDVQVKDGYAFVAGYFDGMHVIKLW